MKSIFNLKAISPVDGRYNKICCRFSDYFSEYGLMKYRVKVEIMYFQELCGILPELAEFNLNRYSAEITNIYNNFSITDALTIKDIESHINHDVKSVEYYIKERFHEILNNDLNMGKYIEFIHYSLTSQDINNTALPLSINDCMDDIVFPTIMNLNNKIKELSKLWIEIPMLSRTHGQPASPTILGKEFMVFHERIDNQLNIMFSVELYAKFGGAVGNFNAHNVAYPEINWCEFADNFIEKFKLKRTQYTTQIDHYDSIATLFDNIKRINNILIDMNRDIWHYISLDYFKLKIIEKEVGSSAMPHKVNPINFENSESNLMIANTLLEFFSAKLPISRLQRDLTDSSVCRNIGVALSHCYIGYDSLLKGLSKLEVNSNKIKSDLIDNWVVISEGIVSILKKHNYPNPYEKLKELTRINNKIDKIHLIKFINSLEVKQEIKNKLLEITPFNYTGNTNL